jgi:hypothetical protein
LHGGDGHRVGGGGEFRDDVVAGGGEGFAAEDLREGVAAVSVGGEGSVYVGVDIGPVPGLVEVGGDEPGEDVDVEGGEVVADDVECLGGVVGDLVRRRRRGPRR